MKNKIDVRELLIKAIVYILGNVVTAFAITLFIKSNVGSDPITIFYSGLAKTIGKSYGTAALLGTGLFLTLALIFARKHIYIGTILGVILLGPCVDLFTPLTDMLFPNELSFLAGTILMIFAQIILGFALGVMISARFGIGGVDAILFRITEVTSLKYQTLKVVIDVLYTVFGVMMGGVIGLGSLVSVVTTGYLAVIAIRFMEFKVLRKLGVSNDMNDLPIRNPFGKLTSKKTIKAKSI